MRTQTMSHFGEHYSLEEKKEVSELGMWIFIASEILFFGGLFTAYCVYRFVYSQGFIAGGHETNWILGTLNTMILITSSLFMALAVEAGSRNLKKRTLVFLLVVGILGAAFLGIKTHEYIHDIHHGLYPGNVFLTGQTVPRGMQIFFCLYFAMTGLHSVHLITGLMVLMWLVPQIWRVRQTRNISVRLEIFGLYWHFVDAIWIFLFPLFYLLGRHS